MAAALWTLGAVSVYIDSLARRKDAIWAEIDIINATTTTMHYYGARSVTYRARGHLWGRSNIDTLEGYCDASTSRTLAGPNALSLTTKLKSIESTRIPDKTDTTNELFRVEMELVVQ